MSHPRLLPLLIAGTFCLPLAACGSDDEPTASATTPTAAAETATTTPDDGSTSSIPADATSSTPSDDGPKDEGPDAATPPSNGSAEAPSSPKSAAGSKDRSGSTPSPKSKRPAAPSVPKALKDYAKGGAPATADEATSVRDSMLGFQEALVAEDAAKACSYTLGLPAKADPSKPTPSCETLVEGSKMAPPTDKDREAIRAAKITVSGDRASIELEGSGVPMPFRNVDGRWRIDYGTLLGTGGSAG